VYDLDFVVPASRPFPGLPVPGTGPVPGTYPYPVPPVPRSRVPGLNPGFTRDPGF